MILVQFFDLEKINFYKGTNFAQGTDFRDKNLLDNNGQKKYNKTL